MEAGFVRGAQSIDFSVDARLSLSNERDTNKNLSAVASNVHARTWYVRPKCPTLRVSEAKQETPNVM